MRSCISVSISRNRIRERVSSRSDSSSPGIVTSFLRRLVTRPAVQTRAQPAAPPCTRGYPLLVEVKLGHGRTMRHW